MVRIFDPAADVAVATPPQTTAEHAIVKAADLFHIAMAS
jgi:hypothetical protein